MNKVVRNLLFTIIGLSIATFAYQYFSHTKALGLSSSPEAEFIQNDLDSLNAEYTKVSSELYKARIALYEANAQLQQTDSIKAGGRFIYLVTFQCTDINLELAHTRVDSTERAFTIVLPVSRDFYNRVTEGNVLQAGLDYGFIYGEDVLYGKSIHVVAKTIVQNGK